MDLGWQCEVQHLKDRDLKFTAGSCSAKMVQGAAVACDITATRGVTSQPSILPVFVLCFQSISSLQLTRTAVGQVNLSQAGDANTP